MSRHTYFSDVYCGINNFRYNNFRSGSGEVLSVTLKPFLKAPSIGQKHYEGLFEDTKIICRSHISSLEVSIIQFFLFFLHMPIRNITILYISVVLYGGALLPHTVHITCVITTRCYNLNFMFS